MCYCNTSAFGATPQFLDTVTDCKIIASQKKYGSSMIQSRTSELDQSAYFRGIKETETPS